MQTTEQISNLLRKHITQTLSIDEKRELYVLMESLPDEQYWVAILAELSEDAAVPEVSMPPMEVWQTMLHAIRSEKISKTPRIYFIRKAWLRYAAAVLVFLGLGAYVWLANDSSNNAEKSTYSTTDLPPGGNKAILTLSDGSKIILDSAANGQVAKQGASIITKLADGALRYDLSGNASNETLINTISTPTGGQYQLRLPDGTNVWLNAASSIKYPVAFSGKERMVEITGEVYFEIAKNTNQPFHVQIDEQTSIQVLGTQFNINSYSNETSIKATLLEGSIKVVQKAYKNKGASADVQLFPGQQAIVARSDQQLTIMSSIDKEKVLAWKNGTFNFQNMHFPEAARQLERWYGIEVVYQNSVPDIQFKGDMDRGVNLSDILHFFEAWGIKASIDGKKLIIQ